MKTLNVAAVLVLSAASVMETAAAQQGVPVITPPTQQPGATAGVQVTPPADYVIGPDDVLGILFWRDPTLSGDVAVRPDGRISLPLLNDVEAVGLTPEQLRARLLDLAKKYVEEPNVTVVVRAINSRKVFITGQVARPGPYPLSAPTTVLQLIAVAGGLTEYADGKKIQIIRKIDNKETALKFNYEDVRKGKKLEQNILLNVGDTLIVP